MITTVPIPEIGGQIVEAIRQCSEEAVDPQRANMSFYALTAFYTEGETRVARFLTRITVVEILHVAEPLCEMGLIRLLSVCNRSIKLIPTDASPTDYADCFAHLDRP